MAEFQLQLRKKNGNQSQIVDVFTASQIQCKISSSENQQNDILNVKFNSSDCSVGKFITDIIVQTNDAYQKKL